MYFAIVFCLMLAAPVGSIVIEHSFLHVSAPLMTFVGKWFVFVLPSAIAAAIFYGVAGFRHAGQPKRNAKETFAMATDLFAFAVLGPFAVFAMSQ
jgi:hypothetical protein